MSIFYKIAPHLESLGGELLTSLGQTFQMLLVSGIFAFFLGIFFGVLLIVTKRGRTRSYTASLIRPLT